MGNKETNRPAGLGEEKESECCSVITFALKYLISFSTFKCAAVCSPHSLLPAPPPTPTVLLNLGL